MIDSQAGFLLLFFMYKAPQSETVAFWPVSVFCVRVHVSECQYVRVCIHKYVYVCVGCAECADMGICHGEYVCVSVRLPACVCLSP